MKISLKYKIALFLLRLLSTTWRYKISGNVPQLPALIVFWHGLMLPVWKYFRNKNATGLVSQSRDGQILSYLLDKWGYSLIRGSAATGGKAVLENMVQIAGKGYLLITPDGAKGPVGKMKPGAVIAAHRAQVPLCICNVKLGLSYRSKKSWDKFAVPLPFSRIELNFSEQIFIRQECAREEIDNIIQNCEKEMGRYL